MALSIDIAPFSNLTTQRLYDILALRSRVFVVEQHCFYHDPDGKDQASLHALMTDGNKLVGYARILPPGLMYDTASIGRIVIDPAHRGRGLGEKLMQACVKKCQALHESDITLTAQIASEAFYKKLGFESVGEIFDEAGIDHRKMVLKHPAPITNKAVI